MLNTLGMLKSRNTHVAGLYHIDGTPLSDQTLFQTILYQRQNPVQTSTWIATHQWRLERNSSSLTDPLSILAAYHFSEQVSIPMIMDSSPSSARQLQIESDGSVHRYPALLIEDSTDAVVLGEMTSHRARYPEILNPRPNVPHNANFLLKCLCTGLFISVTLLMLSMAAPTIFLNVGLTIKTVQYVASATALLSTAGLFAFCMKKPESARVTETPSMIL